MTQTIFNPDENAATIFFSKIYSADVTTVWNYYTQPGLFVQWWMPRPWRAEVISQDFREGGKLHYAAIGPNGEKQFAGMAYNEIKEHRSISISDYFTDESGNSTDEMPAADWLMGFTGVEEGTKVTINMHFRTVEDLHKTLESGFEQGLLQAADQLEEILTSK